MQVAEDGTWGETLARIQRSKKRGGGKGTKRQAITGRYVRPDARHSSQQNDVSNSQPEQPSYDLLYTEVMQSMLIEAQKCGSWLPGKALECAAKQHKFAYRWIDQAAPQGTKTTPVDIRRFPHLRI